MNTITEILQPLSNNFISLKRNTDNLWYELEIGIPNSWVFDGNEFIECSELRKTEKGLLIKIAPLFESVTVDDLFNFVYILIDTNKKIAEKENEFTVMMTEMKTMMEDKAKNFYLELDEMKANSFSKLKKETIINKKPLPSKSIKKTETKPKKITTNDSSEKK